MLYSCVIIFLRRPDRSMPYPHFIDRKDHSDTGTQDRRYECVGTQGRLGNGALVNARGALKQRVTSNGPKGWEQRLDATPVPGGVEFRAMPGSFQRLCVG